MILKHLVVLILVSLLLIFIMLLASIFGLFTMIFSWPTKKLAMASKFLANYAKAYMDNIKMVKN